MTSENGPAGQGNETGNQIGQIKTWKGLSAKLLILTIAFIMLAEILIFVPSVANFRNVWLRTHLDTAEAAVIVYDDSTNLALSNAASMKLLEITDAVTIAVRAPGRSQLLATTDMQSEIKEHIDLDGTSAFGSITSAFGMLFAEPESLYRVFGSTVAGDATIELVQPVKHIQAAMWNYARNILILSLLISVFAAGLVYLALYRLIVLPIIRISANMDAFSRSPEEPSLIYKPGTRHDEIGVAENRLASFQRELQTTLKQKQHLAELGLAVSKINHDLRNILASAQLFSDRIGALPDPTVQRVAPKLLRAIDRAVDYTKSVMAYGRAIESAPNRRRLLLHNMVAEIAELLGLDQEPNINLHNRVDPELEADADPEQLLRVLMNLCRNACQAMTEIQGADRELKLEIEARRRENEVDIWVRDTGPGIPEHLNGKLFSAFQGSTKSGGTGLGMSIAQELVKAHGGQIELENSGPDGTCFRITIPDGKSTDKPDTLSVQ